MTPLAWVRRAQQRLVLLGAVRALGWAGAAGIMGLAIGGPIIAAIVAVAVIAGFAWHMRFVRSLDKVALWLEERLPNFRYALVTAVDPRYVESFGPQLAPHLGQYDAGAVVRRAMWRSVLPAVGALCVAMVAFKVLPKVWTDGHMGPGGSNNGGAVEGPNRLTPLRGLVTPPAYALEAGIDREKLREPSLINGIVGSTVELSGPGSPQGVEVKLGDSTLALSGGASGWRVHFTLPDSATALRLSDRDYHRLIVLAPQRDQSPIVQLLKPTVDTTLRAVAGSIVLDARLIDDLGLRTARFEFIVSSGESEGNFTSRSGSFEIRNYKNDRESRLQTTVPLTYFQIKPGDLLSLRAVAIDNNTWNGPDTGYSEPRTIRIARPGEYDSLAVEGAPPPADSAMMTLRYLIKLTDDLNKAKRRIVRAKFVDSSQGLGIRAERLRSRVQQLQADQTMGGMFPPNPLLNEAYLALAEGEGALKVAEPGEAIPFLWVALKALQKYAWATRYYLRGKGGDVLVDLARVRLAGTDTGHAKARTPRGVADSTRARLRAAYAVAMNRLQIAPDSARDPLALLQVDALRSEPTLAAALGEAIVAIQDGQSPTRPLERARRLLDGGATVADTLPRWSGSW